MADEVTPLPETVDPEDVDRFIASRPDLRPSLHRCSCDAAPYEHVRSEIPDADGLSLCFVPIMTAGRLIIARVGILPT